MSTSRPSSATKNQLIELVLLALGSSHGGLKALRGVLGSDPRLAVLGSSVDLQPVWEVLEAQPDFSREAAIAALCFVKGHEERLGIEIKLPAALAGLAPADRVAHASRCRPPRDEVEKVLEGELRPVSQATGATAAIARRRSWSRREIVGMVAGVVAALSAIFVTWSVTSTMTRDPEFERLDAGEFAGDLPIGSARMFGTEVRAQLVDNAWLKQPEDRRRKQMEAALDRLSSARNFTTLIVEDTAQNQRATAQFVGRSRKIQVRFY